MKTYIVAIAMLVALSTPPGAQLTPQQQKMKDCNAQARGMTGDARQQFMSSCLSGGQTKKPHCVNGKLCGSSCIAKNEVCHQS
jgi:psiF repeat